MYNYLEKYQNMLMNLKIQNEKLCVPKMQSVCEKTIGEMIGEVCPTGYTGSCMPE